MSRPKLPEGLYISVSQLKAYLTCPAFYFHKYVWGDPPAFLPVSLVFGSAVHEALAAHYMELKTTGGPLRRDLLAEVFMDAWGKGTRGQVPVQVDEDDSTDLGVLADKGVGMLRVFHENAISKPSPTVEAVERRFEVEIHDPDCGEVLEEKLVGVIDLIALEDGRRFIWEHKRAAKRYAADQLAHDVQPTAYRMALGKIPAVRHDDEPLLQVHLAPLQPSELALAHASVEASGVQSELKPPSTWAEWRNRSASSVVLR